MAIRLEDLLASFRRHLRAAAKAPRTIELEQTYQRVNGTARLGGRTVPLTEARLTGDRLTFSLGNAGELRFEGTVEGNQVSGTFTDGSGVQQEWSAQRTRRGVRKDLMP